MSSTTSSHKYWTLVAVSLGTFMLLIDITIVVVALPSIQGSLHTSLSDVQWTLDAYSLSLASLLLPTGSLADILGRKRVFAMGLAVFTVGSLLCGLASSALMLILCRALQGIGGATIFATSLALLAGAFHGKERGLAFGIWGGVVALSSALGPLLGGLLTTEASWRWIFFVNLPIGVIAILITVYRVSESRPPQHRRFDPIGFVLFTVGLTALVYGLIESSRRGWGSSVVVVSIIIAAVLLTAFPITQYVIKQPMFDLKLFRKPTFVGGAVAAFGINGGLYAIFVYIVLYLQNVDHKSALGAGAAVAIVTAGSLITAIPSGRLSAHMPVRWLIGPGLLLIGIGLLLMRGLTPGISWTHLIPGFAVAGLGSGMVNSPLASTAVGVVQPQDSGMASGINSTFRQVGIATMIAVLGTIFASKLDHVSGAAIAVRYPSAINELLLICAVVAFVTGVASTLLIRQKDFIVHGGPPEAAGGPATGAEEAAAGASGGAPVGGVETA